MSESVPGDDHQPQPFDAGPPVGRAQQLEHLRAVQARGVIADGGQFRRAAAGDLLGPLGDLGAQVDHDEGLVVGGLRRHGTRCVRDDFPHRLVERAVQLVGQRRRRGEGAESDPAQNEGDLSGGRRDPDVGAEPVAWIRVDHDDRVGRDRAERRTPSMVPGITISGSPETDCAATVVA